MGLLNRILGKKTNPAKEIIKDIEICKKMWINYINNYPSKKEAADRLLAERGSEGRLLNPPDLVINAAKEIENKIPNELIDIET